MNLIENTPNVSKVQNAWMFNFDKFYNKIIFIWSIFGYMNVRTVTFMIINIWNYLELMKDEQVCRKKMFINI